MKMEQYVDWFNLMAYDLHGTWDATDIYSGGLNPSLLGHGFPALRRPL